MLRSSMLFSSSRVISLRDFPVLPGVFTEYETWSVSLRGKQMLRLLENRMLMKIYAPKMRQPIRSWTYMPDELHTLYFSQILFRLSN
jgi:hypothetical protein